MSATPTIADQDIAYELHAAINAAGARASVRMLDSGQWVVRFLHGQPRDDRDEWLSAMSDRLRAAAGVEPLLELED